MEESNLIIKGKKAVSRSNWNVPVKLSIFGRVTVLAIGVLSFIANSVSSNETSAAISAVAAILLSAYLVIIARKNRGLLVVFCYLFLSVYSSCVVNYFGMSSFSVFQQWAHTSVSFISINIILLFLVCILILMPLKIESYPTCVLIQEKASRSGILSTICIVAFLLCGLLGVGSASAVSDRFAITPIYEYSIVFLIVGLYFTGESKWSIVGFAVVSGIRIVLDFGIGSRVTSIEILAIWYIMIFASRIKLRSLIPLAIIAFIAMLTVGELRGSEFELSAITSGINDYLNTGFAWDGAYAAFHTSESMVAYRDMMSYGVDFLDFGGYLASLIVGDSTGYVDLQTEMQPIIWNMGGGYFPFYFYYYLGYPGVFVSSILISLLIRFLAVFPVKRTSSDLAVFVYIWICSTCFRWLSYSASPLARGLLIVALVFIILGILAKAKPVLLAKSDYGSE